MAEKGVSLWLPALKDAVKPEGDTIDPVQVNINQHQPVTSNKLNNCITIMPMVDYLAII